MKRFWQGAFLVGIALFMIPMLVVSVSGHESNELLERLEIVQKEEEENKLTDIMSEEALVGILAKEIPYNYEEEAIKAQAVITRTYMARRILGIQNKGALVGYTVDELKALWGEDFEERYEIYRKAVEETALLMILYNNQPIEALYHGASSGKTRDAASVYNQDISYLKGVDSSVDHISKQIVFSKEELVSLLQESYPNLIVDIETLENQIQIIEKDDADYIKSIQIGNVIIKGEDLRQLLELPSSSFRIFNSNENLIFNVQGIGNGVGLSQNGANELAKQGMLYQDIIKYYYTDITIEPYEVQNIKTKS